MNNDFVRKQQDELKSMPETGKGYQLIQARIGVCFRVVYNITNVFKLSSLLFYETIF